MCKLTTTVPPLFQIENGATVVSTVFSRILNAPNNSTVKIFTSNLNYDGISSLLLLVSVFESRKERGLKFEIYLDDFKAVNIYDFFAESSNHKIKFKANSDVIANSHTLVVIEGRGETSTYRFNSPLNSVSLKDSSQKKPIVINFLGDTSLKASPFRKVNGVESVVYKASDRYSSPMAEQVVISYSVRETKNYTETHISKLEKITQADLENINKRAYDLALQLYLNNKGELPPETVNDRDINIIEILELAVN